MTVAWILWRSHEQVLEVWDPYRTQCYDWHLRNWHVGFDGPLHKGYFLEPYPPATLSGVAIARAIDLKNGSLPVGALSLKDAKLRLWKVLADNVIQATGLHTDSRQRVVIPDHEWRDLKDFEERGRDVVRMLDGRLVSNRGYDDLAFRRQNIMAIWHPSRIEERGLRLPKTMSPEGPGYMPLYCAAQWIATQGGSVTFEPTSVPTWEVAYSELLARISSNEVTVTGMRDGAMEKLEGHLFAFLPVSYPFVDTPFELIDAYELYLLSYAYVDQEHWRNGFDDSLEDRVGKRWSKLLVLKSDIARCWPFPAVLLKPETHSGGPGRPSAMHLIEAEYDARRERGEISGRIGAIAADLAEWARRAHPKLRTPGAGAIENTLRDRHRKP